MTGKIEHDGRPYPGHPSDQIIPEYRGPPKPPPMVRITCAMAKRLDWSWDGSDDDIVSYEVIYAVRD